jgi:hypothetical protein
LDPLLPKQVRYQAALHSEYDWCDWPESNWHAIMAADFKSATATYYVTVANLEQRVGFEPTVLGICNPLHWAALPPLRCASWLGPTSKALYIVGPLPLRKPIVPPSAWIRLITSSKSIGAKSGSCSTLTL